MPKVSGEVDASYTFDFFRGSLTPRVQVVYRGSEWARIFNEPSLDRVPSYTVTNLNLEYLLTGTGLRLDLTATNVFNVAGVNSQYTDPYGSGQTSRQYIPPRQVIFTIGYRF
jgi:iron complex outermembrane receptor protein